jgi:hypothetical protein
LSTYTKPPGQSGDRPCTPRTNTGPYKGPRPFDRDRPPRDFRPTRDVRSYEGPNEPLPPREPSPPKELPPAPDLTVLFANRTLLGVEVQFWQDGEAVKPKKSHGFVAVKVRHHGDQVAHFVLVGETLPTRKAMHRALEEKFQRIPDGKLVQIHLSIK